MRLAAGNLLPSLFVHLLLSPPWPAPRLCRFSLPGAGPFSIVATALPAPTLAPGPLYSQPPLVTVLGFLTHPNSQGMEALQSSLWVCA